VVTGRDVGYLAADCVNDAGAFMAEYKRERRGEELVANHHVGMADPCRNHLDYDFVRLRVAKRKALKFEIASRLANDRGRN
jgi:hypothetical protein